MHRSVRSVSGGSSDFTSLPHQFIRLVHEVRNHCLALFTGQMRHKSIIHDETFCKTFAWFGLWLVGHFSPPLAGPLESSRFRDVPRDADCSFSHTEHLSSKCWTMKVSFGWTMSIAALVASSNERNRSQSYLPPDHLMW
jgi:hypothetical protein